MQELLKKEQCPKQYIPVLALFALVGTMLIFDTSRCRFAKLSCDMEMWTINARRLWQLNLLSRLEATELVAYFPSNKIKWLEWHTNTKESMTEISSSSPTLLRKYSKSTHWLPALFTWPHQDDWLLQSHLECRSYLYLLFYILHDHQYLPFFFFLLLTQCSSLLKTWQNLLKMH